MTVVDFEAGRRSPHPNNLSAIRAALEAAGVEFIAENGGGAGVRLRRPASAANDTAPPRFKDTASAALDSLPGEAAEGGDHGGSNGGR